MSRAPNLRSAPLLSRKGSQRRRYRRQRPQFFSRFPKCLMKKVSVARLSISTILSVPTVLSKKVKDCNFFSTKKILFFALHIDIQIPIIQCDRGIRTKIAAKSFGIRLIIVKHLQRCRLGFCDITEMAQIFNPHTAQDRREQVPSIRRCGYTVPLPAQCCPSPPSGE